jgi:capsular polysaccharide biosynthesis protein
LIMELIQFIRVLLRRWWLVLIPTVIVAAFTLPEIIANEPANAGGYSTVIRYTAAQRLDAIPNRDGDFQDVWLASELTVNAFTEWVRANRFAWAVAEEAATNGLQFDAGALSIAADNERSIGQIFLNWHDADELRVIADAVSRILQTRSEEVFPQLGGESAQVVMLDDPVISAAPPPLQGRLRPIIQLLIGIAFGVGLAFFFEYLDPTVRQREELEHIGIPVMATVPR